MNRFILVITVLPNADPNAIIIVHRPISPALLVAFPSPVSGPSEKKKYANVPMTMMIINQLFSVSIA